jgi:hypothetical protein
VEDPTRIGNCEECGESEYLVLWHGRWLCHLCGTRGSVPLVVPEPLPLHKEPKEPGPMTEYHQPPPAVSAWRIATWVLIVLIGVASLAGHMTQATRLELLEQSNREQAKKLDSIDENIKWLVRERKESR